MTPAVAVIGAIKDRKDRLAAEKLASQRIDVLLYFAQGHHLARHGEPLFGDELSAWVNGDVFVDADIDAKGDVDAAGLDTIDFVIRKYGSQSLDSLRKQIRVGSPWREASAVGEGAPIDTDLMLAWFADREPRRERLA